MTHAQANAFAASVRRRVTVRDVVMIQRTDARSSIADPERWNWRLRTWKHLQMTLGQLIAEMPEVQRRWIETEFPSFQEVL